MAHQSEGTDRLERRLTRVEKLRDLESIDTEEPGVYLLLLPPQRSDADYPHSTPAIAEVVQFCGRTHPESTICVLTTPADAARFGRGIVRAACHGVRALDRSRGGYSGAEKSILWAAIFLFFAIRGGNRHAVDARIGKEF